MGGPQRTGRPYRRLRRHILTTRPAVCAWCGKPIDLKLSGFHPQGPTVDHIVPVAHGGTNDPTNLQPMHRACNLERGTKPLTPPTSREW